jgi:hypothetical protein
MDLRLATLKTVSFLFASQFVNTASIQKVFLEAQLCVNTLPANKVTLITGGI